MLHTIDLVETTVRAITVQVEADSLEDAHLAVLGPRRRENKRIREISSVVIDHEGDLVDAQDWVDAEWTVDEILAREG